MLGQQAMEELEATSKAQAVKTPKTEATGEKVANTCVFFAE